MVSHYDGFAPGIAGKPDSMLIPAFSLLIKQGTACSAEGDIKITMTMSILNTISGTVQLSEMYSIDFVEDICIIGHSGGAASPTTDRLCLQIVDWQIVSPRFFPVSLSQKRKWTVRVRRRCCSIVCRFPQKAASPLEESAPDQQKKSHPLPEVAYSFL